MRAAVVFFSSASRQRILELAKSLSQGIGAQGHQVDLIDGDRDVNAKLTGYQYLAIGAEPLSGFGGKLPDKVQQFLGAAGLVSGKHSFAFVSKTPFGSMKALSRLMKSMEKEGMLIRNSSVLSSVQEAQEIGKRLHVK
jgi:menaquinone-dependent protoporphyrinogen IX oxidase